MDLYTAPSDRDWYTACGYEEWPEWRPTPGPERFFLYGARWWAGRITRVICPRCSADFDDCPPGLDMDTGWRPLSRAELLFFRARPGVRCRTCGTPAPAWPLPPDDNEEDA
jgi:hypothetical protein